MGADVRLAGRGLAPPNDVVGWRAEIAGRTGAQITLTDDVAQAVAGCRLHPHRRVGVDGRAEGRLGERIELLMPYQVNTKLLDKTGNPAVKFMHCLPAFHDREHGSRPEDHRPHRWRDGLEVTDEVFESPASIVFDQAENRLHTIKAILVATLRLRDDRRVRGRTRRQRLAEAGRTDDRGGAAAQRADRGNGARTGRPAPPAGASRTATVPRSACSRCRRSPTRRWSRIHWMSWAHRHRA